ncbi:MAG: DUF4097 family beta strand repeat-containing protein [Kangiellaceae bacterium]|jgi:hypothetical protein|nr:DUF4097 family beta strand repeat-containing protein [Kangiellaceae bacterium]
MTRSNLIKSSLLCLVVGTAQAETIIDEINRSFPVGDSPKFALSNINGDAVITTCDCSTITVNATIKASSQEQRDRISIEFDNSSNLVEVQTRYKKRSSWNKWNNGNSSVTYAVTLPKNTELDKVDQVNGDIEVKGITGSIKAESVNGTITISDAQSDADISTVNGTLTISYTDLSKVNDVELSSVNGSLTVYLPENADAKVSAETVNGRISNSFGLTVEKGRWVGNSMKGTIGSGRVDVSLESVNGRVKLKSL